VGLWRAWQDDDIGGWTRGEGENCLVLLHGGPDLSDYLEGFGDLLAQRLGKTWSVTRYQQRGLPPSTTRGPFTIEQEVRDLLMVCDGFGTRAVWILGHSWGGHLAMHALVAAPNRFRGAVLVDPLGAYENGRRAMFKHFASLLTPTEAAEWTRLEELSTTRGLSPVEQAAQDSILWPYYFSDPVQAPPPLSIRPGLGDHWESIDLHFEKQTLLRGLPSVSTPSLFLAGTKSPIPYEHSVRTAELMPESNVVLLPTGHFPWMERSTDTIEPIASFL
jgi:pimeloyl-ACP methyl ester carboxylesterase